LKAFSKITLVFLILGISLTNCADKEKHFLKEQNDGTGEEIINESGVENSGIYAIWYGDESIFNLPTVIGGQVVVQWRDIESSRRVYDFSVINAKILELRTLGKVATLQVNGNRKPDYLFDEVPWVTEKLSHQVQDPKGSLMYWHSAYISAYKDLLKALGEYLNDNGTLFLGIRLNFNSFGTEHSHLPDPYYKIAYNWNYPETVQTGVDWTTSIMNSYESEVIQTYIKEIAPYTKVFVRNNIDINTDPDFEKYFNEGTLSLFHTSSESEPRTGNTERQYLNFYNYCRSGKTSAYAESWASSLGHHGGKTDDRVESMPQWFYWRLLLDLHCGVSQIAVYGRDLEVALKGVYLDYHDDAVKGTNYQKEFNESLKFASKYAGYHASPKISPGAWVAFRGNNIVRNVNGYSEKVRTLHHFTDDYDFLMKRLPDNSVPVELIGSKDSRYGSWARKIPQGQSIILEPDSLFLESLSIPHIKIIWFDQSASKGKLLIEAGKNVFETEPKGEGNWIVDEFTLTDKIFTQIKITSPDSESILHMVEITRY
jgi:hypothetical protein